MTREEAIDVVESFRNVVARIENTEYTVEALDMALSALRPVSRERVEKVFGGKWEEETYTTVSGRRRVIHSKKCTCSACGKANGRAKTNFCPHCGAPMTDEAEEMVMRRLEALKDGKGD